MNKFARTVILLAVLALAIFLAWDYFGQEKTVYTDVLVLNRNADSGTVITAEMLETKSQPLAKDTSLRPADAPLVVGKETVTHVAAGTELSAAYFEDPRLIVHPDRGEVLLPVSCSWLITDPLGIARGDEAAFYTEDGREILSCMVAAAASRSEAGSTVTVYEYEINGEKKTESCDSFCPVSVIVTEEQMRQLLELTRSGQKLLITGK